MKHRYWLLLLTLPFLIFLVAFEILPLWQIIVASFHSSNGVLGLGNYKTILTSPFYKQAMVFSLKISLYSSVLGIIIACWGVSSIRRVNHRWQNVIISFVNMTSNFAGVPLAFAFIILLGFNGVLTIVLRDWGLLHGFSLYTTVGLTVVYTYFQIPLGILFLYPAFNALNEEWRESAALLGASHYHYWRRIALPILTPAIIGTFVVLLANALGAFATVYALTGGNFNMVPVRIAALVSGDLFLDPNLASALAVLLILLLAVITIVQQLLLKRSRHAKG